MRGRFSKGSHGARQSQTCDENTKQAFLATNVHSLNYMYNRTVSCLKQKHPIAHHHRFEKHPLAPRLSFEKHPLVTMPSFREMPSFTPRLSFEKHPLAPGPSFEKHLSSPRRFEKRGAGSCRAGRESCLPGEGTRCVPLF